MEIKKDKLLKALETVRPGLASKEMIEQSTSFCFLEGKVTTFNDEISISTPLTDFELTGAVNAEELYSFVKKSKTEDIKIELSDNEILLKSGRAKAGLTLQNEIVLPLEEIGKIKKWKKLPDDFSGGLSFAMGAAGHDFSEPVLTCVHVNKAELISSDRFRIVVFTLENEVPVKPFLIPATTCSKLIKLMPVEIAEGEGWIHFKDALGSIISCRIFEDSFPDVSKHIKVKGNEITFPKSIIGIIDRADIFSKRDTALDESIEVRLHKNKIEIKSESNSGWFKESAKTNYKGEEVSFKVTPYLLRDILNETTTGKLDNNKILFTGEKWKYLTLLRG